jgi:SAM-dependent methyltransferase
MKDEDYLTHQKSFWNVATLDEARFDRVDTRTDRTESSWNALAEEDIQHVYEGIEVPPGATVLELGCGVGRLLLRTRKRVPASAHVIGVDISDAMIRFTAEATKGEPNVSLHVTDGARLPMIKDNSIHFGYSLHVFIHISDGTVVQSYLREIHRVLIRGGRFRFNTRFLNLWRDFGWSPGALLARGLLLSGRRKTGGGQWRPGDPAEFNGLLWREGDLQREIEAAGLSVQSIGPRYDPNELWCDVIKR